MTVLELARLQFAVTAGFHFLFVTLTLGLAPLLAVMQTRYVLTGEDVYGRMTRFWGQLYLINYAVGIVTGLVMEFQFGLDWSGLSRFAGNVFGAPLALETLIAFFLESTFLGMWIFGWGQLPRRAHLVLIWLVTLTAYASAFWIMVANGFLQHPAGGTVVDGVFRPTKFTALVTNDEALGGLAHVVGAALLTGGLFVAGVSAGHLLRGAGAGSGEGELYERSLCIGVVVSAPAATLVINRGFAQLDYLDVDQPAKVAAAFGEPVALDRVAAFGAPPSWLRVPAEVMRWGGFTIGMLTAGVLVLLVVSRGRPADAGCARFVLRPLSWAVPVPFVLVLCGWVVREEGRQPWLVYRMFRTEDALSPVGLPSVIASFTVFVGLFWSSVQPTTCSCAAMPGSGPAHPARSAPRAGGRSRTPRPCRGGRRCLSTSG